MPRTAERTPLARQIYALLLHEVKANRRAANENVGASITYGELAEKLRETGFPSMYPRNGVMHAALGEVALACHAARLPALPAIVWRRDTARPGDQYYAVAHPAARTEEAQRTAWKREHDRVHAAIAKYPRSI